MDTKLTDKKKHRINQLQSNITLLDVFYKQVTENPTKVALQCDQKSLTYQELDEASNRLARYLKKQGVQANTCVAICMPRQLEMIIAIWGILKAGAAYVPIDPQSPEERKNHILKEMDASIILETLPNLSDYSKTKLQITPNSEDLAYVLFTSGSTGYPKGVMITHANLFWSTYARLTYYREWIENYLLLSPVTFDSSVAGIFWTAACGGKLIIPTGELFDAANIARIISEYNITHFSCIPTFYVQLLNQIKNKGNSLRLIIVGSEACLDSIISLHQKTLPNTHLYNEYGPTECCVWTTVAHLYDRDRKQALSSVVIGKPLSYVESHIVDSDLKPVKKGEKGELLIGGHGVAKGYLNAPTLTDEKFIINPFGSGRLYRTGDCVRELPDGNLMFLGRLDDQIKIRGFRVELGDVEHVLFNHPHIEQAVVLSKKNEHLGQYLAAFLVLKKGPSQDKLDVINFLKHSLPSYMIPSQFFVLDRLLLNQHGKIDRQQLLALPDTATMRLRTYVQPQTEREKEIRFVWAKLLHRSETQISVEDNFFEIGGHSLLVAKLVSELKLSLTDLYQCPTIRQLAKCKPIHENSFRSTSSNSDDISLSPIQQLIWSHQQLAPNQPIYNEAMNIKMPGGVDPIKLEEAINALLKRHAIFRAQFQLQEGIPAQRIRPYKPIRLRYLKISRKKALALATIDCQRPFDLENDTLIRFLLVQYRDETAQLFITTHHLVVDGISMFQIFAKELEQLYQNQTLSDLTVQYTNFVIWQNRQEIKEETHLFWKNCLQDVPITHLLTQKGTTRTLNFQGKRQILDFNDIHIDKIQSIANKANTTVFTFLFTVFNILIYRYTGQNDLAIGTVISTRTRQAIQNTIGNFLETVIVRTKIESNSSFLSLLEQIKQNLETVYQNQSGANQTITSLLQSGHMPIQVACIYQPGMYQSPLNWQCSQLETHSNTTKFDLTFELDERENHLIGRVEYSTELFEDWFIQELIQSFYRLLKSVLTKSTPSIDQSPILSDELRHRLLVDWNQNDTSFDIKESIHHLFEKQVKLTPNHVATIFEGNMLTYLELNQLANQYARFLMKRQIRKGDFIGVCCERNHELIAWLLAILKIGAAYVPLDYQLPSSRLLSIIETAQIRTVLIADSYADQFKKIKSDFIYIDRVKSEIQPLSADNFCFSDETNSMAAYAIFTSGSTGRPKGVLVSHQGVVNLLDWVKKRCAFSTKDVSLFVNSLGFDLSVFDIFGPLSVGGAIYIVSDERRTDPTYLASILAREKITFWNSVPALLQPLMPYLQGDIQNQQLRLIFLSGDWIPLALPTKIRQRWPLVSIVGLGGQLKQQFGQIIT